MVLYAFPEVLAEDILKTYPFRFSWCIPSSPKLCILGDISELDIQPYTTHLVLTAPYIDNKIILMNWKLKNDLYITQYRNLI